MRGHMPVGVTARMLEFGRMAASNRAVLPLRVMARMAVACALAASATAASHNARPCALQLAPSGTVATPSPEARSASRITASSTLTARTGYARRPFRLRA